MPPPTGEPWWAAAGAQGTGETSRSLIIYQGAGGLVLHLVRGGPQLALRLLIGWGVHHVREDDVAIAVLQRDWPHSNPRLLAWRVRERSIGLEQQPARHHEVAVAELP
eukprot:CAMPEP_0118954090 /NCGR_PEP_ID=MMETSP1169-20130426/57684_1 /TAXON_ID=36882 /ORGANISM="Pyramimonas obovata, Strain CCMP722" /LENGTH=107 /DNA_ID=CAMNT_0006901667 /DNA_START=265 /DNA_END=585 /DNA_ORIENTATION=+